MAKLLNRFRGGIPGLLLDLCIHFGEKQVPTTIIRRAFLPKVRYVDGSRPGVRMGECTRVAPGALHVYAC